METLFSSALRGVRCRGASLLVFLAVAGCGDSSGDDEEPAAEMPPGSVATSLELLDALPEDNLTLFDPGIPDITFSHFGYSDFTTTLGGDCADGITLERALMDVSVDFDALFEHHQVCSALEDTGAYEVLVEAARDDGTAFETGLEFSTTTAMAPDLQVQDSVTTPRDSVAGRFRAFVDGYLIDELNLPDTVAPLIEEPITSLVDSAYGELLDADPLFAVTTQRVTYASRRPDGSASSELTGLVAFPDTASSEFVPREFILVLSHSTGVTPSDLDPANGWYAVASLFASRGYLVIAPDNWGRGGTDTSPETFLMSNRTAANSLDMIRAVVADPAYEPARGAGTPRIAVVGYSQGGHTALALWQAIATQAPALDVPRVYAGAGPYDLYATAAGVVEHAAGACDGAVYCRYVTDETTIPFLTERVLPGYLEYAATSLVLEDMVDADQLTESFVSGFLGRDPAFDTFKGLLQQGSFTNFTGGLDVLSGTGTRFVLFHSQYDRLVPIANTEALVSVLDPHFTVDVRTGTCNSDAYEAIFNATDRVGVSHALCGFEMLSEVYGELQ